MMYKNEKTAPYAPTAIGAEQSNQTSNSNIIAENSEDFKGEDINYQEIMRRMADPYYIHVMTLSEPFTRQGSRLLTVCFMREFTCLLARQR